MKQIWRTAAIVSALTLVIGPGIAAAGGGQKGGSTAADKADKVSGAEKGRAAAVGDFKGRHTMEGEVTKIDHSKGMFSLKTNEGTLELHAPASALAGVKEGDRLAVEIAVRPTGMASSPATSPAASPRTDVPTGDPKKDPTSPTADKPDTTGGKLPGPQNRPPQAPDTR